MRAAYSTRPLTAVGEELLLVDDLSDTGISDLSVGRDLSEVWMLMSSRRRMAITITTFLFVSSVDEGGERATSEAG